MTLLSTLEAQPHSSIRAEVSDDLDIRQASDRNRVSLGGPWETDYWTHELGVSPGELKRIVRKVGNSVTAVRKELGLVASPMKDRA
jgi:hypothetical protein